MESNEHELINRFCDEVGAVRKTLIALVGCNRTANEADPYVRGAVVILVNLAETLAAETRKSEAKVTVSKSADGE